MYVQMTNPTITKQAIEASSCYRRKFHQITRSTRRSLLQSG